MATFLFRCPKHGEIEVEHPIGEPHPRYCPVDGEELQRVWKPLRATYKGEGWTEAATNNMRTTKTEPTSPDRDTPYR